MRSIGHLLALGLVLRAGLSLAATKPASKTGDPQVLKHEAQFKGESCTRCHEAIRDVPAEPPVGPVKQLRRRQVVVVGGGMAGLSTAHFLRDLDVLVLEKEDKAGGHERREYYRNGPYPVAAVYLDKPEGVVKDLMAELHLKPSPIHAPAETLKYGNQTISEWFSDGVGEFPPDVRPEMRKLSAALTELTKRKMVIPIMDSDKELLAQYEGITFWDYLDKNFGALSARMGDMFAKDMFGAGAKNISAFMGLQYIMDMMSPMGYSWPGGLGVATEALAKELGPKVVTGALVVSTRQSPEGVLVTFKKDGKLQSVQADAVVFATHSLVTQRVAKDLSDDKMAAMAKIKYSTYVTVPLSFREKVWETSYSIWSLDSIFTDVTFAAQNNSHFPGTDKMPGQVAVAYLPMGEYDHAARRRLLATTDEQIIARVKTDLEKVLPGSVAKLADARVIRWGHAMPLLGPNYFRDIQPVIAKPEKRYFFAGEDTQAPALEGAVYSGYYAARDARAFLGAPK
jgi:protoporphyrinogen/coproporphyrinogen III oxidase